MIAVRVTSLVLMTIALFSTASAQAPQDSRITVAHPGFNLLKSDLQKIIDLTTPVEQKQWENIEGYIDTFIIGIDETREVQVQVMTGINPAGYLICVPLQKGSDPSKEFRENLDSLDYVTMRDPGDRTMYSIESAANEYGWMRIDAQLRYAFFMITTDKALLPKVREIVLKAALTPTKLNENMIAELRNTDVSAAAITHRIDAFKPIREENLALIKQRPDEKATAFQLRFASARQLFDEAERIMSQADQLLVTLTVDRSNPVAPKVNLRTTATAIPGAAMEATIAQYGTQSDAFAKSRSSSTGRQGQRCRCRGSVDRRYWCGLGRRNCVYPVFSGDGHRLIFHNFFFFSCRTVVYDGFVLLCQFLNLILSVLAVIFRHRLVFLSIVRALVRITANVANCHAGLFSKILDATGHLLAAFRR